MVRLWIAERYLCFVSSKYHVRVCHLHRASRNLNSWGSDVEESDMEETIVCIQKMNSLSVPLSQDKLCSSEKCLVLFVCKHFVYAFWSKVRLLCCEKIS